MQVAENLAHGEWAEYGPGGPEGTRDDSLTFCQEFWEYQVVTYCGASAWIPPLM